MPSANVAAISDKMQYPDQRDGFISWIRGEFAAANAIIDSLCSHLKIVGYAVNTIVGEGGEYDFVIGSIQQRRRNWNPVLHMQQYFSVAEVVYALQQVTWRRQFWNPVKVGGPGKVYKRSGGNECSNLLKNEMLKNDGEDTNGLSTKLDQKTVDTNSTLFGNYECEGKGSDYKCNTNLKVCCDVHLKNDSSSTHTAHLKPNGSAVAKTFVGSEMLDGKQINAVEGLKMYDDLFDDSEVGKMGDHSQPHSWPHWFGRPICVLFLTECDITFGRIIGADRPGDHRGSINLSLTPGSMLVNVMEGRSADFSKHDIPLTQKQRILVTFTKSQPKAPPSPTTPPNHIRHPTVPKHIFSVPAPGHAPGTGVFLPPGGNSNSPPQKLEPEKEHTKEDCNGSDGGLEVVGGGETE
ncbi:hypothetical protein SSX86_003236 [Deinandra increscens subsp. villosa]|uniref:Oxoglutarate/iron-dependent dioxygenase n=1 Tax=Deinandra increscens subsp. villosa TaxID=3103831 RepID=A0AAP0DLF1_9ASTR